MLILITGPQGSGKTQEAKRLASLLKNQTHLILDGYPRKTTVMLSEHDVIFITTNATIDEIPEWILEYPYLIHFTMPAR